MSDDEYDAPPDSLGNKEDAASDDDVANVTPLQQKKKKLNTEDAESDEDVDDGPTLKKKKKKKKKKKSTEGKITKLLEDLLSTYAGTWITINMDRFYGGPKAAMALLDKGLFMSWHFQDKSQINPT
eukprot:scaffold4281_cov39-Attheya_sp.AAC.1